MISEFQHEKNWDVKQEVKKLILNKKEIDVEMCWEDEEIEDSPSIEGEEDGWYGSLTEARGGDISVRSYWDTADKVVFHFQHLGYDYYYYYDDSRSNLAWSDGSNWNNKSLKNAAFKLYEIAREISKRYVVYAVIVNGSCKGHINTFFKKIHDDVDYLTFKKCMEDSQGECDSSVPFDAIFVMCDAGKILEDEFYS